MSEVGLAALAYVLTVDSRSVLGIDRGESAYSEPSDGNSRSKTSRGFLLGAFLTVRRKVAWARAFRRPILRCRHLGE